MAGWNEQNISDQGGRIVVVTGANSGLGLQTTKVLAAKGAHVIMAARNLKKAEAARVEVLTETPDASLDVMPLDLGKLDSVHQFAAEFKERYDHIDLLYNNAGVMALPYGKTEDGFELQFGINHLGHFALTNLLLDHMMQVKGSRIVTISSTAAWMGQINFDDLQSEKSYSRYGAYGQSKLANLLFARDLERRLRSAGAETISNVAHPGLVMTNLQDRAAQEGGGALEHFLYYQIVGRTLAQNVEMGTLPQLYAGVAEEAVGGAFYGPSFLHSRGYPTVIGGPRAGKDMQVAARLWDVSLKLTGVPDAFALATTPA